MSALGTIGKIVRSSLSRGGARKSKKSPAPELEKALLIISASRKAIASA